MGSLLRRTSTFLPLFDLSHWHSHADDEVLFIVSNDDDFGVSEDFDSLLGRQVH